MSDQRLSAPDFTLPATGGGLVSLSALRGGPVVLFFYPKDDTPGCTTENLDFTALKADFDAAGVRLFGISKDSAALHEKFCAKHDLKVPLLSDDGSEVCEAYGVWKEKSMYGKKYMGVIRSHFVIDEQGRIADAQVKVSPTDSVARALATLEAA